MGFAVIGIVGALLSGARSKIGGALMLFSGSALAVVMLVLGSGFGSYGGIVALFALFLAGPILIGGLLVLLGSFPIEAGPTPGSKPDN